MKNKVRFLWLIAMGTLWVSCAGRLTDVVTPPQERSIKFYNVTHHPPGALQLDPGVFIDPVLMDSLKVSIGEVVLVTTPDTSFESNIYPYPMDEKSIEVNSFTRKQYSIPLDSISVIVASVPKPELAPRNMDMYIESYPGDTDKWGSFVVAAPHGDCDLWTGEVVQRMNELIKIPTVAAFNPRFTFLGRWFDQNRALTKQPKSNGYGTIRERIFNKETERVFFDYLGKVRKAGNVSGNEPMDFLCSFHGHDLKMKDQDGNRVNRDVIEAYGVGFTTEEYYQILDWFNELSTKYYDDPPIMVFGNLKEHQIYNINGQDFEFWYTGLGTRTYGSLRKDNVVRGLHMETPNRMRFNPGNREKTAQLFSELFTRIKTECIYPIKPCPEIELTNIEKGMIALPETDITIFGKQIRVSEFEIDKTEVTAGDYAGFLNAQLRKNLIRIENQTVYEISTGHIFCKVNRTDNGDIIHFDGKVFIPIPGKQHHPIGNVSWYGATAFANASKKRLPTETEWIRAAGWNQTTSTVHAVKSEYLDSVINFDNSIDPFDNCQYPQTTPIGYFEPNINGLYDMSGNVWEWCSDWYHSQYYKQMSEDSLIVNPKGPNEGTMRTFKGGSWGTGLETTKVNFRIPYDPNSCLIDVGFRCVKDN